VSQLSLAIHGAMLADRARNEALAAAVAATVRPGDLVVDVGTGSGLLAMLAVRAGARHVFAIESGFMAGVARRLVALNRMDDRITVVHAMSDQFELPGPADAILCETLGFAGLDERFRPSLADARDRMLRPGGRLMPQAVRLVAAPVVPDGVAQDIRALDRVCGLDYSPLAEVLRAVYLRRHVAHDHEVAAPAVVLRLDCAGMPAGGRLDGRAEFRIAGDRPIGGFALWFEATLAPGIELSSRSPDAANHWGQAFLPVAATAARRGDRVRLSVTLHDAPSFRLAWSAETIADRAFAAAEAAP
jgi:hypothetical protein